MGHAPGSRCRLHVAAALVWPVDVLITPSLAAGHWRDQGARATR